MEPAMAVPAKKLTYEDYCAIPDDGKRHELVDGEHFVSPSPRVAHQDAACVLYHFLMGHLRPARRGWVFIAPLDVVLDDHSVVEPDVLVILPGSRARIEEKAVFGPPDLVAEVLSPSCPEHDLVRKRRLYEQHGVREYWVLDPATGRAEVYRQETGTRFGRPVVLYADKGETLETPLLPGFAAPLAEVFDLGLPAAP